MSLTPEQREHLTVGNVLCNKLGIPQMDEAEFLRIHENVEVEEQINEAFEDVEDVADMLGKPYIDTITGFTGTVVMVGQDIEGVIQALLQPHCINKNVLSETQWISINRLEKEI